jgi:formate dehydrogenase maturation protein FdhE
MATSENDQQVLRTLSAAREQREELTALLNFYYDLYQVQFQAKAGLPEPEGRDELAMRWRLEGGIPQLTFDQLGLEPEPFAQLVTQMIDVLVRHNPTWQFEQAKWTPEELITLAREIFETWDTLTAPKPDFWKDEVDGTWPDHPLTLAVGFALAPYLQRASDAILPHLDLTLWTQNHCPICGGQPNFAVLEEARGARRLMCSRCNTLWHYQRVGCPFCKSQEKQMYYPSKDGVYRLYVCPVCNRYLKTMDLRGVYREVQPVVERLLTVGMDLAAQQEGFGS